MTDTRAAMALIGTRRDGRPVWWHQGAVDINVDDGDDDDDRAPAARAGGRDDDDDDDDPDLPDEEDTDGEGDGWQPPTREEWERQQEATRRNNGENRRYRQLMALAKRRGVADVAAWVDEIMGKATGDGPGDTPPDVQPADTDEPEDTPPAGPTGHSDEDLERAVTRATERAEVAAEMRYMPMLAQLAVEAALNRHRWSGKDPTMVMKLIDLEDVAIEDDDKGRPQVVGIDEQIERVKEEFPLWFQAGQRRGSGAARRQDSTSVDGGQRTPPPRKQTWEDKVAASWSSR
jgi:hypothetical protein